MNFIFISPNFPHTYWNFCDRLRRNGINVLGIGDSPYDGLEAPLKSALTEYYKVDSLEDYDQVYRAVAYFAFRYGKIDWVESMNEYWLEQDARLRDDFNVTTGIRSDRIGFIKEKSLMKGIYLDAGIPTARQHVVSIREAGRAFIEKVGYPVIVKPDIGVGATNTWKLESDGDFEAFYDHLPEHPYVMEEFIEGIICSYDAITNSKCEPLFESMTVWPPVMDIVNKDLDLMYYTCPEVPEQLRTLGRRTVKAFGVKPAVRAPGVLPPDESPQGPGQGGGLRRAGGQHAARGRLHAGHDELCPLDGRLPDLCRHGGPRRTPEDGGTGALLLRLRQQEGWPHLCAHPRGNHAPLRRGHGDAGGDAPDELAADGPIHVHGEAQNLRGGRGVYTLRTGIRLRSVHVERWTLLLNSNDIKPRGIISGHIGLYYITLTVPVQQLLALDTHPRTRGDGMGDEHIGTDN